MATFLSFLQEIKLRDNNNNEQTYINLNRTFIFTHLKFAQVLKFGIQS